MLRIAAKSELPTNYSVPNNFCLDTKCAEIHFEQRHTKFTIRCVSCEEISVNYFDFIQHYKESHLDLNRVKEERNDEQPEDQWIDTLEEEVSMDEAIEDRKSSNLIDCIEPDNLIFFQDGSNDPELDNRKYTTSTDADDGQSCIDWTQAYSPNLLNRKEKRPYKPRNQPNRCNYCGKTFRRRYQLDTHLNIHTGLKPHQCDVCGRQFRAINTLQRHLNTHEKREIFTCKYCSKEFSHRAAYVSHETRHTQSRQIPCDDCNKLFYTDNQLDTHKRKMHLKPDNSQPLPYACDLCDLRYRSASMLSTHKFKKHYRTAKYICGQCDKKFVEEDQLKSHMRVHVINGAINT